MTVAHTYKVEWTDEPRATLFIDGTQRAEHTTDVPTVSIRRFIETISDSPSSNVRMDVGPGLLL